MDNIDSFVRRAERYADRHGLALSTFSFRLFNDGKLLGRLKANLSGITVKRLSEADARLAALEAAELSPSDTS